MRGVQLRGVVPVADHPHGMFHGRPPGSLCADSNTVCLSLHMATRIADDPRTYQDYVLMLHRLTARLTGSHFQVDLVVVAATVPVTATTIPQLGQTEPVCRIPRVRAGLPLTQPWGVVDVPAQEARGDILGPVQLIARLFDGRTLDDQRVVLVIDRRGTNAELPVWATSHALPCAGEGGHACPQGQVLATVRTPFGTCRTGWHPPPRRGECLVVSAHVVSPPNVYMGRAGEQRWYVAYDGMHRRLFDEDVCAWYADLFQCPPGGRPYTAEEWATRRMRLSIKPLRESDPHFLRMGALYRQWIDTTPLVAPMAPFPPVAAVAPAKSALVPLPPALSQPVSHPQDHAALQAFIREEVALPWFVCVHQPRFLGGPGDGRRRRRGGLRGRDRADPNLLAGEAHDSTVAAAGAPARHQPASGYALPHPLPFLSQSWGACRARLLAHRRSRHPRRPYLLPRRTRPPLRPKRRRARGWRALPRRAPWPC